ncbi:MAG: UDP-N-acetylglucosamine pyrophosphorylase [Phylliscum demangeonii]|nr:MAG: UDP-N-acetylglucosamine pyrophosphorylase [Phylliscum demangeonii]
MATAPGKFDPDERVAASQFIITLGDNLEYLNGKAAIFGRVVEGFDVLEKINTAFCDESGRPLQDIRIRHTVVLDDPYDDPDGLILPAESPVPTPAQLATVRIADDENLDEDMDEEALERLRREREARAQALTLEMVGDLPFAEVKPPENVLFVCKLNPVTQDEDLDLIFSRFGKILSCEVIRDRRTGDSLQYAFIEFENQKDCEQAYFKMQGVLIDDHRIHVDFSQSVSKLSDTWRTSTNAKRAQQKGGFGGISSLEKKRQYKAGDHPRTSARGYNMVFDAKDMDRTRAERDHDDGQPSGEEFEALRKKYAEAHQDHVFTFWESLGRSERGALYDQLSRIDPDRINEIVKESLNPPAAKEDAAGTADLEPLPESSTASVVDSDDEEDIEEWKLGGLELIAKNKVAVVLMAGGQGTRLGSSAPKGCFDIGLRSHKSLFQLQAERILKVQELAQEIHPKKTVVVPWYIMTSGPTRDLTEKFFKKHKYFGLKKENVVFFEQGVLPCVDNDGKILLESKSKVAVAPDGNGGLYKALVTSAVIGDMGKRGIQHVHAYCVDNCLVRVADPVFVGFAASKNVDIATKVVRKRNANESVGLIVLKNGRPDVVEYSEIDKATAEAMDSRQPDVLKFRAANIVNHYYSYRFLESIPEWADRLPFHVARKKIPHVSLESGNAVKPKTPNGIKLEQFVFDVFPRLALQQFACLEVKREDEFSPLKNAKGTGEDDPDTSRADVLRQGLRFFEAAGGEMAGEGENEDFDELEVSPLVSYTSKADRSQAQL